MEDNIFNIVSGSSQVPASDFVTDQAALDTAPSDLSVESLSQEEVIGQVRGYLTKLDKKQSSQQTNVKGDIKGELDQLERLVEELEGKETIDQSTLRYTSKEAEAVYDKASKKLEKTAQGTQIGHKLKKTASLRRMLAETPAARSLQNQLVK